MSLNARWRCFKIVAPQEPSREQELIGGLQNALLRGEDIIKAKQSFISAGYEPKEIEAAAEKISTTPGAIQQKTTQTNQQSTQIPQQATSIRFEKQKTPLKKILIIIIPIALLILIGAALLGIFWNKIF